MIAAASAFGGCGGGRSGAKAAGTIATSAAQRSGWRIANCIAESAPADPPMIGTRSMSRWLRRSTNASAWFSEDGSSGKSERRYPKREGATTCQPAATSGAANATPWSKPPPVPWIIRTGGPLPATAYSIAPKRLWKTSLRPRVRARACAPSIENARQTAPPARAAPAPSSATKRNRRLRMACSAVHSANRSSTPMAFRRSFAMPG